MLSEVRSYINETKERAAKEGFAETILGRKRMITMGSGGAEKAKMERVAVNYTVQGTASEIFKTAIVEMEKRMKSSKSSITRSTNDS